MKWLLQVTGLKEERNEIPIPTPPTPKFPSIVFYVLKVEIKVWGLCEGYATND